MPGRKPRLDRTANPRAERGPHGRILAIRVSTFEGFAGALLPILTMVTHVLL